MPGRGLEPPLLAEPDPKSGASANFATRALLISNTLQHIHKKQVATVLEFVLDSKCEREVEAWEKSRALYTCPRQEQTQNRRAFQPERKVLRDAVGGYWKQ